MELLENDWEEIQNLYIQSLGENTSGKRWISFLINKMWDIAWDLLNFWNHTLHTTEGPRKLDAIDLINKRVTHQLEKGSMGLPTRCHFLFHTSIRTMLTRPIRQGLSWMTATTRARWCFLPQTFIGRLLDTYELLLGRIAMGMLIPTLSHIDEDAPLQTTTWPCLVLSVNILR